MGVLWFMIPATLLMAFFFLGLFIWAARSGQFDDLVTPSHEIFLDEDNNNNKNKTTKINGEKE